MNRALHDSLFQLYISGGLELALQGVSGCKRDLIIDLETSALSPEMGDIIHFYAVNRWDENDVFDELAKPSRPLSAEAEQIVGTTNERLSRCRPTEVVLTDFLAFLDGAEVISDDFGFELGFLKRAIAHRSPKL